jgi:hypothetical protein
MRSLIFGLCDETGAVRNFVDQIKNRTNMQQTVV